MKSIMKLIIAGGRDFSDYSLLEYETQRFILEHYKEGSVEIISGKAKGADSLGELFAKKYRLNVIEMPAKWDDIDCPQVWIKYNKQGKPYNSAAGVIRNEEMAIYVTSRGRWVF